MITNLSSKFSPKLNEQITKFCNDNQLTDRQELDVYSIVLTAQQEILSEMK